MRTLRDLGNLRGRRALVCGAAGHIGAAVGQALAEQGADVCICDLDADGAATRAAELAAVAPGRIVSLACDLAYESSTRELVHDVVELLGGLDILVHAAALVGTTELEGWAVPFEEQTVAAWDAALRVKPACAFVR